LKYTYFRPFYPTGNFSGYHHSDKYRCRENLSELIQPARNSKGYPRNLALLESRIRVGVLVVADNADMRPDYLAAIRDPKNGYLSVPFGEDVELSQKLR